MSSAAEISCDIAIVGAGLVGAGLAAALARSGLSVTVIEPAPPVAPPAGWDARIYAISPASRDFLAAAGAWERLDPVRVQPVLRMAVAGDAPGARLDFSADDAAVVALAWIVESGRLQEALWQRLAEAVDDVRVLAPARCAKLEVDSMRARIELEDGRTIAARLVVGADGAQSWVRRAAGLTARAESYGQVGVVANFACARPHQATAYQWFRADGVLAYLPVPGERMSMVWSTPAEHAKELLALDAPTLCRRVAEAGGGTLGALELVSPPRGFPLLRLAAESMIGPRVALIGDAAHVVHPLAGQGVNLGFGDARALAQALRARRPGEDCGARPLLRRYERARAEPILAMRALTHGLVRLFGLPGELPSRLRNAGLNFTDRLPVLKAFLVRHAVG